MLLKSLCFLLLCSLLKAAPFTPRKTGTFTPEDLVSFPGLAGDNWFAAYLMGGPSNLNEIGALFLSPDGIEQPPHQEFNSGNPIYSLDFKGMGDLTFYLLYTWDSELGQVARLVAYDRNTQTKIWTNNYDRSFTSELDNLRLAVGHSSVYLIDPNFDRSPNPSTPNPQIIQLNLETGEAIGNPITPSSGGSSVDFGALVTTNSEHLVVYENVDSQDTLHFINQSTHEIDYSLPIQYSFWRAPNYLEATDEAAFIGDTETRKIIVRVAPGEDEISRLIPSPLPFQCHLHNDYLYYLNETTLRSLNPNDLSDSKEFPLDLPGTRFTPIFAAAGGNMMVSMHPTFHFFELDPGTPTLSFSNLVAFESEKKIEVLVEIDQAIEREVAFTISTSDSTAQAGLDYLTLSNHRITIPAGETAATFSITLLSDSTPELDEEFDLHITNVSNATLPANTFKAKIIGSHFDYTEIEPTDTELIRSNSYSLVQGYKETIPYLRVERIPPLFEDWTLNFPGFSTTTSIRGSSYGDLLAIGISGSIGSENAEHGKVILYSVPTRSIVHTFRPPDGVHNPGFGKRVLLKDGFLFCGHGDFSDQTSVFSVSSKNLLFSTTEVGSNSVEIKDEAIIFRSSEPKYYLYQAHHNGGAPMELKLSDSPLNPSQTNLFSRASFGSSKILLVNKPTGAINDFYVYEIDRLTGEITNELLLNSRNSALSIISDSDVEIIHDEEFFYISTSDILEIYDFESHSLVMTLNHEVGNTWHHSPSALVKHEDRIEIIGRDVSRSIFPDTLVPRIKILSNIVSEEPGRATVHVLTSEPSYSPTAWKATISPAHSEEFTISEEDFSTMEFILQGPSGLGSLVPVTLPAVKDGKPEPTEFFNLTLSRNDVELPPLEFQLHDYSQIKTLEPDILSDSGDSDLFGTAIACNSTHAFFAMPGKLGGTHKNSMRYIAHNDPENLKTLTEPAARTSAIFGANIIANDDYLVVSEVSDPSLSNQVGRVFVYRADDFTLIDTLQGGTSATQFGLSAALSDSHLFIGDPALEGSDGGSASTPGKVYVYSLPSLEFIKTISAPTPQAEDDFGYTLSTNDHSLAISAPGIEVDLIRKGQVYLHDLDTLELTREFRDDDQHWGVEFGEESDLGPNHLVAGNSHGEFFVFDLNNDLPPVRFFGYQGRSVRIEGNIIVVAEPFSLSSGNAERGSISFWTTSGQFIERVFGTNSRPSKFLFGLYFEIHNGIAYVTTLDDDSIETPTAKITQYVLPDLNPSELFFSNSIGNEPSFDFFSDGSINLLDYAFSNSTEPATFPDGNSPLEFPLPDNIPPGISLQIETSRDLETWSPLIDLANPPPNSPALMIEQSGRRWVSPALLTFDGYFRLNAKRIE